MGSVPVTKMSLVADIGRYFDLPDDKRLNGWPLMESPLPTLGFIFMYLYGVRVYGPRYMNDRKPFELKKVLICYNIFQVVYNAYIFYEVGMSGWFNGKYNWKCQPVDYSNNPDAIRVLRAGWLFYISKLVDFADTVFFILRKKNSQVTTLHVIHHSIMPMSVWFVLRYAGGGHSTFMGLMNTFVHVVMYSYYMLSALGPALQKYLWWKKYLTTLQLIQFVLVLAHAMQLFFTDCSYPKVMVWVICSHSVMFFYLFMEFYNNSYGRRRTTSEVNSSKVEAIRVFSRKRLFRLD